MDEKVHCAAACLLRGSWRLVFMRTYFNLKTKAIVLIDIYD